MNKLGKGSRKSRDFQQVNEDKELGQEIFLGDILLGHRQEAMKNRVFNLGKIGLDEEELGLLGRGGKLPVSQLSYIFS